MVDAIDRTDQPAAGIDEIVPELTRKIASLELALASSRIIGAAVGIVMERNKLTYGDAFDVLVGISQRSHLKLREIAEQLVYTGALPDLP